MSPVIPWTAGRWAEAGRCGCSATVYPNSFRDRASWDDFRIAGLCQACQDRLYFARGAPALARAQAARAPTRRTRRARHVEGTVTYDWRATPETDRTPPNARAHHP